MYIRSTIIALALTLSALSGAAHAGPTDDPTESAALANVPVRSRPEQPFGLCDPLMAGNMVPLQELGCSWPILPGSMAAAALWTQNFGPAAACRVSSG
jgi:hypothetical protein